MFIRNRKPVFKISPYAIDMSVEASKVSYLNRIEDKYSKGIAPELINQKKAIAGSLNCKIDDFNKINIYNSELLNDMMNFHHDFLRFEKDEQDENNYISYEEPYVPFRRHPVMIAFQKRRFELYTNTVLFPKKREECRYPLMVIRHKIYILREVFLEISRQLEPCFDVSGNHRNKRHINPNRLPLVLRPVINVVSDSELDKIYEEFFKNDKKPSKEELLEIEKTREMDLWFEEITNRDRILQIVYEIERAKGSDKFFL